MKLKPTKAYWSKELLDYFLGTENNPDKLINRTDVYCWLRDNSHTFKFNHSICRITDNPFSGLSPTTMVIEEWAKLALEEFGSYDYEFDQSRPCGGWKYLDIIVC